MILDKHLVKFLNNVAMSLTVFMQEKFRSRNAHSSIFTRDCSFFFFGHIGFDRGTSSSRMKPALVFSLLTVISKYSYHAQQSLE